MAAAACPEYEELLSFLTGSSAKKTPNGPRGSPRTRPTVGPSPASGARSSSARGPADDSATVVSANFKKSLGAFRRALLSPDDQTTNPEPDDEGSVETFLEHVSREATVKDLHKLLTTLGVKGVSGRSKQMMVEAIWSFFLDKFDTTRKTKGSK